MTKKRKKISGDSHLFNEVTLTPNQKILHEKIIDNTITFVYGPAGTSKTFTVCYAALKMITEKSIDKIIITKPVEESGERLGFLPGTVEEKIGPYFESFFGNMSEMADPLFVESLVQDKTIQCRPLAHMRGATYNDAIMILDEAQNCVPSSARIATGFMTNHSKIRYITMADIIKKRELGQEVNVWSFNSNTNMCELQPITHHFKSGIQPMLKIKFKDGSHLRCTTEHPIAIHNQDGTIGYIPASQLKNGDITFKMVKCDTNNAQVVTQGLDLLLGSLLGDGTLSRCKQDTPSYRHTVVHGITQHEYLDFYKSLWNGRYKSVTSGYTGKPLISFSTKSLILPKEFISACYKNGVKKINRNALDYMTERTLAIWLMDDGHYNGKNISLATHGFDKETVEELAFLLDSKFDIKTSIQNIKHKSIIGEYYYQLWLDKENTIKFISKVKGLILPSMSYKVGGEDGIYYEKFQADRYDVKTISGLTASFVESVISDGEDEAFNIEVSCNNNYFVGKTLTHNCDFRQLMLFISRMGRNSKVIIAGDVSQYDIKQNLVALPKFIEMINGISSIAVHEFGKSDIVRNPILIEITDRYEQWKSDKMITGSKL